MKKKYTVVGFYADTQETFVGHAVALSADNAVEQILGISDDSLCIVAVFKGHQMDELAR